MTDKEIKERKAAIEFLREVKIEVNDDGECLVYSSWEIEEAIKALEKQIPKKPQKAKEQVVRYTEGYICPLCGKGFTGTGIADFCYHCGQALDWSV